MKTMTRSESAVYRHCVLVWWGEKRKIYECHKTPPVVGVYDNLSLSVTVAVFFFQRSETASESIRSVVHTETRSKAALRHLRSDAF